MKLAEALILRADYQKRAEQLKQRLLRVAKVQEGEQPAEDPTELLAELEQVTADFVLVIQRINRTNVATDFDGSRTLADALAERDVLRLKQQTYRDLAQTASITQARGSRSEVKFYSTVSVVEIQRQVDNFARDHRELDTRIQGLNWTTDLLD
jgi:hypothetical protein